ncbi:MFS transporter [Martelella sp. HB161492]|uniref:MFS transporter n=1 Tax=Martelella sp. HB161492 TaxID=2720726 RepID=UPI001591EC6B|nr:MFS transporter [Martelella sp. HB161492]
MDATNARAEGESRMPRDLWVLTLAQALGASSPPIIMSLGALVGGVLAPHASLATLPVAAYTFGIAVGTLPVAGSIRRAGMRRTYMITACIALLASLCSITGIAFAHFWLFCLGTGVTGIYGAAVQSYRFSAARTVAPELKGRAISNVMAAGLVAAVIGPQIVVWTGLALPDQPYLGGFAGQAVLALLALSAVSLLRPGRIGGAAVVPGLRAASLLLQPRFAGPVAAGVISYIAMTLMMTSAPMAMVACGHSVSSAALGIQWHVLAMYLPSLVTGRLIDRFGAKCMTPVGLILLALSAVAGLAGVSVAHFWAALILLGVGWNFTFISATTMLVQAAAPEERSAVEGANDFVVFGSVAVTALLSGYLYAYSGWDLITDAILALAILALAGSMIRKLA